MIEQDWIILRLIDEIDRKLELSDDSTMALLYLIKKYGRKTIFKNLKFIKKEDYQKKMTLYHEMQQNYLQNLRSKK